MYYNCVINLKMEKKISQKSRKTFYQFKLFK